MSSRRLGLARSDVRRVFLVELTVTYLLLLIGTKFEVLTLQEAVEL